MKFLEILRLIRAALAIGTPPDIKEEAAFRKWCCEVLCFLAVLAELTASDADDKLVAKLHAIADNDQHWSLLYAIILAASQYVRTDDSLIVGDPNVQTLADEVEIDPGTVIFIVQLVLKLVEMWRKR